MSQGASATLAQSADFEEQSVTSEQSATSEQNATLAGAECDFGRSRVRYWSRVRT